MYSDQNKRFSLSNINEMKNAFKPDLNDNSDRGHQTLLGIEFQTENVNKTKQSPSVALLCAGLLRRCMVHELERVLRVCDGFFCRMSVTYDGAVLLYDGSTNKPFCKCFLL